MYDFPLWLIHFFLITIYGLCSFCAVIAPFFMAWYCAVEHKAGDPWWEDVVMWLLVSIMLVALFYTVGGFAWHFDDVVQGWRN